MDNYTELLSKIDRNSKELVSDTSLSEYNIFNVLGIERKEVVMCRFLADLLNPEGKHECGILFLKSFFEDILKKHTNDTLLAHLEVETEFVIDNGRRIDIVIKNANAGYFIPMEVKIDADDQEGQCYDYFEYAKAFDENTQIVYLTKFGDKPSVNSRKNRNGNEIVADDKIIYISWEKDIRGWLAGLLTYLNEPIQSMVIQYINTINSIADRRDIRMIEKSVEVLHESVDFFSAGLQIEKSMKAAKLKLIRLVFDDFKKEMDKITSQYGLELEPSYYFYEEKRHEKFYDNGSTYPGLNYVVRNIKFRDRGLQMWFRIEVFINLYAGFFPFDTEAESENENVKGCGVAEISPELINEVSQYLDRDIINPANGWFTWCYPNGKYQDGYYDDVPDFMNMNQCAISLVDSRKRKEFVENAVKVFEEHLLKYLRNA